jgi:hypothetical protein
MEIIYKVDSSENFEEEEKNIFIGLLGRQGRVEDPSLAKFNSCPFVCIVYADKIPVGIGAIKQVYKAPFDKAGVSNLKSDFDFELGYLFVDPDEKYKGKKIGKSISEKLLEKIEGKNVFATTQEENENPMYHILMKFGFSKAGKTYKGRMTGDAISLFVRTAKINS